MAKQSTQPWHAVLELRADIKGGDLSQKQFAADLHDVMLGRNPGVYHDPAEFFALTYPTVRMRDLVRDVTRRLAGVSERAVRQLFQTFGGGKTHLLITLVHLVQDPASLPDCPAVQQFRAHCGLDDGLPRARVAAVVFDHLDAEQGMEARAPDGTLRWLKMPWSLLAWQLAGPAGLELLKSGGDERPSPPATNVLEALLELGRADTGAVLILFDEVLWFVRTMVDLDPGWETRMADFFHSLTQAVAKVPRCCLVASLLASDNRKLDELGRQLSKGLYDEFKRVADEGIQPVESHDVPEILRRRLFTLESYQRTAAWPTQVMAALNSLATLDEQTHKGRSAEQQRYLAAYPFHPDLIDLIYRKWAGLEGFQQTRGILKTLATALHDAAPWDRQPLVGAQVFLAAGAGLSSAARELANIAQLEQFDGRKQHWPAILEAELAHAVKAQEGLPGVGARELEQAVVATFLHSQPIGQHARTRELKLLMGLGNPDPINLDKGLRAWAETSWYLDDGLTADREGGLPKTWRLGSRPNLKQMHHAARAGVGDGQVDAVLEQAIADAGKLTEGTGATSDRPRVRVNRLPARPADIEDDDAFHYAVLGPAAASEPGKPSATARRFLDETSGPDKPRARNRNAVVLAVPSQNGLDAAREKARDLLGWEEVARTLKERDDIDTASTARLATNLKSARAELASHVVMAYCIAVTVDESNRVAAYRISVDNEPLFPRLLADRRLRIESTAVNAEALLPGGPYDLWAAGDSARYVKDLVGAFAATASLPKMLNREAILETLLQGCAAGDFVLRVTRGDRSQRTFWRNRPEPSAIDDPTLEVVLLPAAVLTELAPVLLVPRTLPGLWEDGQPLTWDALADYFSGRHLVSIDKGAYREDVLIPATDEAALKAAVTGAIKAGGVWLVNGTVSLLADDVPAGFLNNHAQLLPPPAPIPAAELLPAALLAAWHQDETSADHLRGALSAALGRPLPWSTIRQSLDQAFGLGLLERTLNSAPWPCDLGGAPGVRLRVAQPPVTLPPPRPGIADAHGRRQAVAALETHEVENLAEEMAELVEAAVGHTLRLSMTVELDREGGVSEEALAGVNAVLGKVKPGWVLR